MPNHWKIILLYVGSVHFKPCFSCITHILQELVPWVHSCHDAERVHRMGSGDILGSRSYTSVTSNDLPLRGMQSTEIHPAKLNLNAPQLQLPSQISEKFLVTPMPPDTERSLTGQKREWTVTVVALLQLKSLTFANFTKT